MYTDISQSIYLSLSVEIIISCREYWHSLTETLNASSMNFSGMATGATILCYMDEFYAFFQVIIVCLRIRSNDAILNFTVVKKKRYNSYNFKK